MIIVDNALKKREEEKNPIRVALVGAGYIGRGITLQIEKYFTGMRALLTLYTVVARVAKYAEQCEYQR